MAALIIRALATFLRVVAFALSGSDSNPENASLLKAALLGDPKGKGRFEANEQQSGIHRLQFVAQRAAFDPENLKRDLRMVEVEILIDCKQSLGEGPLWDVAEQMLYWVDTVSGEIWRCSADGSQVRTWKVPGEIGCLALREKGGALVALDSGLHFFDFETGGLELLAHPEKGKDGVRFNDGKVDRNGRFLVASIDLKATAGGPPWRGRLFRFDTDLSLHEIDGGYWISNGPCWSPDDRTFYHTDSRADAIYAFDWDSNGGIPSNKRVFAEVPKGSLPDGATVDAEGYLWSAANGAEDGKGGLYRYAPDGTLDRYVAMPTPKVTSIMFGGPKLDIAFVTTMNFDTGIPMTPYDGKLLAIHGLGVQGLPEPRFRG